MVFQYSREKNKDRLLARVMDSMLLRVRVNMLAEVGRGMEHYH